MTSNVYKKYFQENIAYICANVISTLVDVIGIRNENKSFKNEL